MSDAPKPTSPDIGARYVLITSELIEKLQQGWSVPVQLKIVAQHGNELELFARDVPPDYDPILEERTGLAGSTRGEPG
jgi:hypothetical protein